MFEEEVVGVSGFTAFPSSLFSPGVQRRVSERQSVLSFIHNTQEQLKSDQIDAFNNNKSHLYF